MIEITKRPSRLSDGSVIYDVTICAPTDTTEEVIWLHAIDEKAADHLVEVLRAALVNYTVEMPVVREFEVA